MWKPPDMIVCISVSGGPGYFPLRIQVGGGKVQNNEIFHWNCISFIDVVKEVPNAPVRQTSTGSYGSSSASLSLDTTA